MMNVKQTSAFYPQVIIVTAKMRIDEADMSPVEPGDVCGKLEAFSRGAGKDQGCSSGCVQYQDSDSEDEFKPGCSTAAPKRKAGFGSKSETSQNKKRCKPRPKLTKKWKNTDAFTKDMTYARNLLCQIVLKTMSQNGFLKFKRYCHLADNHALCNLKVAKMLPLYNRLNKALMQYNIFHDELSIDKSMVP